MRLTNECNFFSQPHSIFIPQHESVMKIKNKYSFKDGNQIWRILLSTTEKVIVETRDTNKKEAFYNCLDLNTGKKIFKGLQLDEKYWIGVETIYKDIIFFHKYTKPDMPGHQQVIAFDINTQKVLWTNEDYSFLFVVDDKVFCFVQQFEGRKYFTLDLMTGELIKELDITEEEIIRLNDIYENEKKYSNYIFPERFDSQTVDNPKVASLIEQHTKEVEIVGDIEYAFSKDALIFNLHHKIIGDSLMNKLFTYDLSSGKKIYEEILDADANGFVPDSFFIYKNLLFILKEKSVLLVCEIIN